MVVSKSFFKLYGFAWSCVLQYDTGLGEHICIIMMQVCDDDDSEDDEVIVCAKTTLSQTHSRVI